MPFLNEVFRASCELLNDKSPPAEHVGQRKVAHSQKYRMRGQLRKPGPLIGRYLSLAGLRGHVKRGRSACVPLVYPPVVQGPAPLGTVTAFFSNTNNRAAVLLTGALAILVGGKQIGMPQPWALGDPLVRPARLG